ncbi:hypothetical protein PS874_01520 [Pseudomonas fluorescens]|nr:hypothetical protein PS874_01520 [Pseudomonas fluorescens]
MISRLRCQNSRSRAAASHSFKDSVAFQRVKALYPRRNNALALNGGWAPCQMRLAVRLLAREKAGGKLVLAPSPTDLHTLTSTREGIAKTAQLTATEQSSFIPVRNKLSRQ